MKMEHHFVPETAVTEGAVAAVSTTGWPLAAAVMAAAVVWVIAWYWDTARTMIATWEHSQTYAHGFLVFPITAWLIWRERSRLARLPPRHDLRVLWLLALPGCAWLLGEMSGVRVVQQFALIFTIVLVTWTLLGSGVARTLAFPLLFLLFAVPVGDFLLPWLMEHTARFTVFALRATGVPAYREGMSIAVPTGNWSVVEACSGLRYLIACFTGGVLFAYLRYRSLGRRLAFIAAAAVVPVVANWLRAYLIVMLGEISGGEVAVDVDHLLYGWIFFGVVTLLLFGIASIWREDFDPKGGAGAARALPRGRMPTRSAFVRAGIAAGVVTAVWPAAAWHLDDVPARAPRGVAAPDAGDWQMQDGRLSEWTPHFTAPASLQKTYAKAGDRAAVYIGYYRDQRKGPELVSSLNTLASRDNGWQIVSESARSVLAGGEELQAVESQLQNRSTRLLAWRWYWVDGTRTTSPYRAKLLQLRSQLRGRGDDAAVVVLYTQIDQQPSAAEAVLRDFAGAALPRITQVLDDARLH